MTQLNVSKRSVSFCLNCCSPFPRVALKFERKQTLKSTPMVLVCMVWSWYPNCVHGMVMVSKLCAWYGHGIQTVCMVWSWYPNCVHGMVMVSKLCAWYGHGIQTVCMVWSWYPNCVHGMVMVSKLCAWYGHGIQTVCMVWSWYPNCVHGMVMVSKLQWKPFWLTPQLAIDPQNGWTGWQNHVNYEVFIQAPSKFTLF